MSTRQKQKPKAAPPVPPASAPAPLTPEPALPGAGRARILVVEDDEDVRRVTREVLESSGYQVWEAADGREAVEVWRRGAAKLDLLVTDIVLPGRLNGWDLVARLRKEQPELKVILISSFAVEQKERNQARDLVLPKPFSMDGLGDAVRNCLGRSDAAV